VLKAQNSIAFNNVSVFIVNANNFWTTCKTSVCSSTSLRQGYIYQLFYQNNKVFVFLCVYQTQHKCYLLTNTAAGTSYAQAYSEKHLKEINSVAIFFLSVEEPQATTPVLPDQLFHRR